MKDEQALAALLSGLDGKGYKAYKQIQGRWSFPDFVLHVDHVQGDPFAEPSRMRAIVPAQTVGLPASAYRSPERALGVAALLARSFSRAARSVQGGPGPGTGRSGEIRMTDPGQKVMPQTALRVEGDGGVEARFTVGLPASGRRILGKAAANLVTELLPELIRATLPASTHPPETIERAAAANEDATRLRGSLADLDAIAFVADGAVLPRRSGIDDRPLEGDGVVPFSSPESMRATVELPNAGPVTGMAVRPGVTLVVGGGFHGKSTLLRALEAGVYNHCPDDGREMVVTRDDAVKVRAEDGRSVAGVDISPFIGDLPYGRTTSNFSTPNASGSTSQASAIVEALESGSRLLLVDEDTSATNFMIRDRRMQKLVPRDGEPITPFVDRVRALHAAHGVSCVLVIGGSGDYLDVADTVVRMEDYLPAEVTEQARRVAEEHPTGREAEAADLALAGRVRGIRAGALDARRGRRERHVRVPDERTLLFGPETIDLAAVEQLVSRAQIRTIGLALALVAERARTSSLTVPEALDFVEATVEREGLDALEPRLAGDLSAFRRHELAAALNRLRSLRVEQSRP